MDVQKTFVGMFVVWAVVVVSIFVGIGWLVLEVVERLTK